MTSIIREKMRLKAMTHFQQLRFITLLGMFTVLCVWAVLEPPKCKIQHTYNEGDSVMVTDVREPITVVILVCRNGHWELP